MSARKRERRILLSCRKYFSELDEEVDWMKSQHQAKLGSKAIELSSKQFPSYFNRETISALFLIGSRRDGSKSKKKKKNQPRKKTFPTSHKIIDGLSL